MDGSQVPLHKQRNGKGGPEDAGEAVKWYRKAAEQGNAAAQWRLAVMYDQGDGVSQDFKKAVEWFQRSAEQGIAPAQLVLGGLYTLGIPGVLPKDYLQAVKWRRLAAEQGDANAVKAKDRLKSEMTAAQLTAAQPLAAELSKRIKTSKSE